ncbi:permease prefix domain 1-containing protein, partial [Silvibacterium sp.]|uniref:permease prefix domain 1-containing protein n=1 Tax=Silvibacterium sp. TaxID=1964179 RepID=UPI0039E4261D
MRTFRSFFLRLLFRRRRYDDLAVSMQEHLEEKVDELMDEGLSREEAEQAARRAFGNVALMEERSREAWQWPTVESILADIRFALRQIRRAPGFAAIVVLTLGLGIGANTAIFTLVHAILLRSLPVSDPARLVRVGDGVGDCCFTNGLENPDGSVDIFSYGFYRHLRETTPEFQQLAAMEAGFSRFSVRRGEGPARSRFGEFVSGNYFETFGVGAFAGRVFTDADDQPSAAPVAIVSYAAWQADFGGDASIVG